MPHKQNTPPQYPQHTTMRLMTGSEWYTSKYRGKKYFCKPREKYVIGIPLSRMTQLSLYRLGNYTIVSLYRLGNYIFL